MKEINPKKIIALMTGLFFWIQSTAQDNKINFSRLTTKEGLSSNSVCLTLKDRYGFLWVATEDGLNRFDGTTFKIYKHDNKNHKSLNVNHIKTLFEDRSGRLWIGTNGGSLQLYDRRQDCFENFKVTGMSKAITSICEDLEGNIWITSYNGLYILNPKSRLLNKHPAYQQLPEGLRAKPLLYTIKDSRNNIWIGSENGLYVYLKKTGRFQQFLHHENNKSSLADNYITTISEDKQKRIWIGTQNGLSMLQADQKGFKNYKHIPGKQQSISSNLINSIAPENEEKLWIGTENGLDILNLKTGQFRKSRPDKRDRNSLTNKSIRSIYFDNDGISWLATYQGGLNKYDKNFNLFNLRESNVFDQHALSAATVTSFAEYKGKGIFIGTDGGGLNLFHPASGVIDRYSLIPGEGRTLSNLAIMGLEMTITNKLWIGTFLHGAFVLDPATGNVKHFLEGTGPMDLNHNAVFCIKEDSQGNVWMGTNGGGVNIYLPKENRIKKYINPSNQMDNPDFPSNNVIRTIEEDKMGRMWIGTFGSGISVWNPSTEKFSFYNEGNSNLSSNYILSILKDSKGEIWIGTNGAGLHRFDEKTRKFIQISEKRSVINGVIHKVVEDSKGNIWVSTNEGISRFDRKTGKFTHFTHQNGLQNSPFILGAGLSASDGMLYFGGQEGFNYTDPSKLKHNDVVPTVIFTDLKVDNQVILPSENGPIEKPIFQEETIRLQYKQNFSIGFVAINYTNGQQNSYEYKLHGFDKDWINPGNDHTACYTNLDPGTYTLQVRASNNDGVWNKNGRSIKVIVSPPLWRSTPAFIFYLISVVLFLLYIRDQGLRELKRKFALQQERKKSEYLRELDLMKIKFLTNLSHEFRTPIALIVDPVERLIEKIKEPQLSGQLQLIKRNGRRLLNLVNQLLDFRKMEEWELSLHLTEGELISFVREVCESFADLAERKKIDFDFNSDIESFYTRFDADKMERILFNLLSNAFKFTPEEGRINIELMASGEVKSNQEHSISIIVTDSGTGISKESQDRIFDRFFQTDMDPALLNQGTGIGLSIVKEFIKMHGGEISVVSELGRGSRFIVNIPFVLSSPCTQPQEIIGPTSADEYQEPGTISVGAVLKNRPTILIVEDDEDFRFYLKDNLRLYYSIYEASNGKMGWQKALSSHPDLIISDVNMPVMGGIEFGRKLKSDKRTNFIPLILITASDREDGQIKGLASGANDYMTKPFNFAVLYAKINNLLVLNKAFKDTYSRQMQVLPAPMEIVSENEKFLNAVLLYIENNINNSQLSVEKLSQELVMSRVSLYKKILHLTGLTPVEFIRTVKLEKAVLLLEKSDMNIAQIAYHVGFTNPNYFSKAFKDKYKMRASEYIEQKRSMHRTT